MPIHHTKKIQQASNNDERIVWEVILEATFSVKELENSHDINFDLGEFEYQLPRDLQDAIQILIARWGDHHHF